MLCSETEHYNKTIFSQARMKGNEDNLLTIDVKNTRKVNGKPSQIEALLYTSWYNDSSIRVCRGILVWDVPQEALDFYNNYIKFKMDSLTR